MSRRNFLYGLCSITFLYFFLPLQGLADSLVNKIIKSDAEWKNILSKTQYKILRHRDTEMPFTSKLLNEHRDGVFLCAGCDLPLFSSEHKFDSGTGWPSFYKPISSNHIETDKDYDLGIERTEFHCARCGGHHGHVFPDGPKPTGLRYCSNGSVLKFVAKK